MEDLNMDASAGFLRILNDWVFAAVALFFLHLMMLKLIGEKTVMSYCHLQINNEEEEEFCFRREKMLLLVQNIMIFSFILYVFIINCNKI